MRDRIVPQRVAPAPPAVRAAPAVRLACIALGVLLSGCSSFTLETPLYFADPGKFLYHDCDQLNTAAKATAARMQDLKTLMAKADQGIIGPLVGVAAYQTDYIAASQDLRLIEDTARTKNCVTPSTWQSNGVIR
jgi:hypothetical protein